jgi:hypothetical protein
VIDMQQFKASAPIALAANTALGLTAAQYAPRAHNLTKEKIAGLPEDIIGCRAVREVQFKIGEVFWTESLPKNLALRVADPSAAAESPAASDAESEQDDGHVDLATLKPAELKKFLKDRGIKFAGNASKATLLQLAEEAQASDDESDQDELDEDSIDTEVE